MLNQPQYAGASILIAGPDFGTGFVLSKRSRPCRTTASKRVPVAVRRHFRSNSGKAGLLIAVVDQKIIEELWDLSEEHPAAPITVDLGGRRITAEGFQAEVEIDDYTRWRLMEGLDDIGLTLRHVDQIDAFERRRPSYRPMTLPAKVASASQCPLVAVFSLQDTKKCKPSDCLAARSSERWPCRRTVRCPSSQQA